MSGSSEQVAKRAKELLESGEVAVVVGYGPGVHPVASTAMFVREAANAADLCWDKTCGQNLTKYLIALEEKVAVFVKGCDSRSLVSLIQDNEVIRDKVHIIGLPCDGMIDSQKVKSRLGLPLTEVSGMRIEGTEAIFAVRGEETKLPLAEIIFDRCAACKYPNPVIFDELIGETVEAKEAVGLPGLDELAQMSLSARREFWKEALSGCILCYACRNACPVCVCQDSCIIQSRLPHWGSERINDREKMFFQMTRAMHVAGRCTGCGECERACPMNIPLNLINQYMVEIMEELFDYEPGIDIEAALPLSTYRPEDPEAG